MKVRIAGLGYQQGDEVCVLSGGQATGYIEIGYTMEPCNLKLLGPGAIGTEVSVPPQYHEKLKELIEKSA